MRSTIDIMHPFPRQAIPSSRSRRVGNVPGLGQPLHQPGGGIAIIFDDKKAHEEQSAAINRLSSMLIPMPNATTHAMTSTHQKGCPRGPGRSGPTGITREARAGAGCG